MSYIGAEPTTAAFPFDQFSGTGAATSFTLTYAPAGTTSILVAISGVMQNPNLYSVIGTTLSFSPAPPVGTNNISVLYLGLPVIGSSSPGNTAFLSSTDLTATAGQTVFASAGSYTPGFVQVYRNGARLGNADFTATNGTTITLAVGATAGDLVTIEYYTLTSLVNALPLTGGTVTGSTTFNTGVNLAAVSGNVGVGTSSPAGKLHVNGTGGPLRISGSGYAINPTEFTLGQYSSTTGYLQIPGGATGRIDIWDGSTGAIAIFNQYGMGLYGTSPTSGAGITFPATQQASSNANTLDDYEEGTWTPTCTTALTSSEGAYVKVGSLVSFSIRIGVVSNASGAAFSLSLPFVSNSSLVMRSGGWFAYLNGGSATPANTTWLVNAGAAEINAYTLGGASRACSEFNASYWIGGQFRTT